MRKHKRKVTAAQRAWSATNVLQGWVPVSWYHPRNPRFVGKKTCNLLGTHIGVTFVHPTLG